MGGRDSSAHCSISLNVFLSANDSIRCFECNLAILPLPLLAPVGQQAPRAQEEYERMIEEGRVK